MTQVHIVYATYGDGEYNIQRVFADLGKAEGYLLMLRARDKARCDAVEEENKRRGAYFKLYANPEEYGLDTWEVTE